MKRKLNGKFRKDYRVVAPCPLCGWHLPIGVPGALSRADNKTEICSRCGYKEAIDAMKNTKKS